MNRLIMILMVATAWMNWACGEATTSQATGEATAQEETAEAPAEATSSSAEGFQLNVLNDTIPSPRKELTATMGTNSLSINYGSPQANGRIIWGNLVPHDKVWRTGANEATRITVSEAVSISGQNLPAGTYGLFTIPGEADWTLIFNSVAEQWGAYDYDESKDVIRVKVVPETVEEHAEGMDFSVRDGNTVVLAWEKVRVPFTLEAGQ
ncbi:MAG: DUF2911 domain-containing protein [Bacteroidota bacterium]